MDTSQLPSSQPVPQAAGPSKGLSGAYEWADAILFAVLPVVLAFTFLLRTVGVQGSSMVPTLSSGDQLVVSDFGYTPAAGDIVVIVQSQNEQRPLIKRVIATEGQRVDIDFDAGAVFVDGVLLEEPYINEPTYTQYDVVFPAIVPDGCIFVMGDNRNRSSDSRDSRIGMVDERAVVGRALFRIFPVGSFEKFQ